MNKMFKQVKLIIIGYSVAEPFLGLSLCQLQESSSSISTSNDK